MFGAVIPVQQGFIDTGMIGDFLHPGPIQSFIGKN